MLNKIYNKIIKYMRENIVDIFVFLIILFVILCPVNYYIITGGGTFDAKSRVSIKTNNKVEGSFNMAYVSEIKGTIFTYLLSYIVPSYDRESIDEYKANDNESASDIDFRNTLWLKQTNNNAIYVAYKKANKTIEEKNKKNYIFYIDEKATTNLKVGDEIISADGRVINELDDLKNYVNTKNKGDKVIIKVKRNNKEESKEAVIYQEKDKLYVGVTLLQDVTYITSPKISFKFKKSESGPSGGLIMTLEIYNSLTKNDLTNGLKIAGTGTIDKDGTVGEIDGVKYKLAGAIKNKAKVFLVPAGRNYKEAVKAKKQNNYKIKIIEVKNINDAITSLKELKK